MDNRIEITVPVQVEAAVHFWIDRTEWNGMTEEQKRQAVENHVEAAYIHFASDCVRIDLSTVVSAMVTAPQIGEVDLAAIEVYDPETA